MASNVNFGKAEERTERHQRPHASNDKAEFSQPRHRTPSSSRKQFSPRMTKTASGVVGISEDQRLMRPDMSGRSTVPDTNKFSQIADTKQAGNWHGSGNDARLLRVYEGWPSPAGTHLGSHLQNLQNVMENEEFRTYLSPIMTQKSSSRQSCQVQHSNDKTLENDAPQLSQKSSVNVHPLHQLSNNPSTFSHKKQSVNNRESQACVTKNAENNNQTSEDDSNSFSDESRSPKQSFRQPKTIVTMSASAVNESMAQENTSMDNQTVTLTQKSPSKLNEAQSVKQETVVAEQDSSAPSKSNNNWINHTPKARTNTGRVGSEDKLRVHVDNEAGECTPAPHYYSKPQGQYQYTSHGQHSGGLHPHPPYYGPNPHYHGVERGQLPPGYPPYGQSPHRHGGRGHHHPVYAPGPAGRYYYDLPPHGMYPHHQGQYPGGGGGYYQASGGHHHHAYYQPHAGEPGKYQQRGALHRGTAHYHPQGPPPPGYEEYAYGPGPYPSAHPPQHVYGPLGVVQVPGPPGQPYDGSPSHMGAPMMVPVTNMHSPSIQHHMVYAHAGIPALHRSGGSCRSSKKLQCSIERKASGASGCKRHSSHSKNRNSGSSASRAHNHCTGASATVTSKMMNPRQLNFNDEMVESGRQKSCFDSVVDQNFVSGPNGHEDILHGAGSKSIKAHDRKIAVHLNDQPYRSSHSRSRQNQNHQVDDEEAEDSECIEDSESPQIKIQLQDSSEQIPRGLATAATGKERERQSSVNYTPHRYEKAGGSMVHDVSNRDREESLEERDYEPDSANLRNRDPFGQGRNNRRRFEDHKRTIYQRDQTIGDGHMTMPHHNNRQGIMQIKQRQAAMTNRNTVPMHKESLLHGIRISQSQTARQQPGHGHQKSDNVQNLSLISQATSRPELRDKDRTVTDCSVSEPGVVKASLNGGGSTVPFSKRRGYMYNEANGQMERVIRKRKRKTASQLEELAKAFDRDPHWTKETLLEIATNTELTEAQVYKWGWDQKRKKFGVAQAERMRQYENLLDQQAQAARKKQQALNSAATSEAKDSLLKRRQPEVTPENKSIDSSIERRQDDESAISMTDNKRVKSRENISRNDSKDADELQVPKSTRRANSKEKTRQAMAHLASAEPIYHNPDNANPNQISDFAAEVAGATARQQLTVKKPGQASNIEKNENLQKSATTNTNTVQVSYMSGTKNHNHQFTTPRESKQMQEYKDDVMSGKYEPECPIEEALKMTTADDAIKKVGASSIQQRRNQKLAGKANEKIQYLSSSESSDKQLHLNNPTSSDDNKNLQLTQHCSSVTLGPRRTTRQQKAGADKSAALQDNYEADDTIFKIQSATKVDEQHQAASVDQHANASGGDTNSRRSRRSVRSRGMAAVKTPPTQV